MLVSNFITISSILDFSSFINTKYYKKEKLLSKIKNWKVLNELWDIIQPYVLKLVDKNVPKYITKLYENLAKYTKPAIDTLFKLNLKMDKMELIIFLDSQ